MTAVAPATAPPSWRARRQAVAVPPLSPGLAVARGALVVVLAVSVALLADLLVLGALQQRASQQDLFDRFRADLAQGTAPVGPTAADGRALVPGTPVAYLEIPAIGLRQVVVEGTAAGTLLDGPGHRRDTPLPGQAGTSILLGRRAAFGGPFAAVDGLEAGDEVHVTTGQGAFTYRVTGVRQEGEPAPPAPGQGEGRLLLVTAAGRPFMPTGVVRVDAEMGTPAMPGSPPLVGSRALPPAERIMEADTGTLWALVLWLQLLIVVALAAVAAWHRWGPIRAWIIFTPPLLLVGLSVAGEAARLLPNLL